MNFPVSSTRPEDEAAELGPRSCESSQADMASMWGFDAGRVNGDDLEPKLLRTDDVWRMEVPGGVGQRNEAAWVEGNNKMKGAT